MVIMMRWPLHLKKEMKISSKNAKGLVLRPRPTDCSSCNTRTTVCLIRVRRNVQARLLCIEFQRFVLPSSLNAVEEAVVI